MFFRLIIGLCFFILYYGQTEAISSYWTPIIPSFCSSRVSTNITAALLRCDTLMDKELSKIFDNCVRSVYRLSDGEKLSKPKLCYYARSGNRLDQCKMMKYRNEGITLQELVDREQEHTWCLMKIAQPLGWERLCSDNSEDIAYNKARSSSIQNCETRFQIVTKPIRECYNEEVLLKNIGIMQKGNGLDQSTSSSLDHDKTKPAACLSFQYSRRIWKCLARKEGNQNLQRQANQYVACLRNIRQTSNKPLKPIKNQLIR